ncbi:MAG TPA: Uma2 family endonuclease, partial [Thermomicrobiales bacterium]|nr:Uma2 family endonuclease [Thermomicrobiales bacterium]
VVGGNAGFILQRNPDTLLAPDAAFVRTDRLPPADERERFLAVVPDLVVEVVSPNDRARDIEEKVQIYLESGVIVALVVYPRLRQIRTYSCDGSSRLYRHDETLDLDSVVPGFSLSVAEVFA